MKKSFTDEKISRLTETLYLTVDIVNLYKYIRTCKMIQIVSRVFSYPQTINSWGQ